MGATQPLAFGHLFAEQDVKEPDFFSFPSGLEGLDLFAFLAIFYLLIYLIGFFFLPIASIHTYKF